MTTNNPFNRMLQKTEGTAAAPDQSSATSGAKFPLGLCIAGIVATSSGLLAAALEIKWGAAPPPGDALPFAWLYVNVMLAITWLVVWPAVALLPSRVTSAGNTRRGLLWDSAALAISSLPALGTAAFVSGATLPMITVMIALQISQCLFAMGVLSWTFHRREQAARAGLGAGLLAALAFAGPILVYLWSEFFPRASQAWASAVPLIAVTAAAHTTANWSSVTPSLWWIAAGYAVVGLILLATAKPK